MRSRVLKKMTFVEVEQEEKMAPYEGLRFWERGKGAT